MSELSQEARALIDSVSSLDEPSADDRARIRKRLAMQLGATAFTAAAATNVGGVTSKALAASRSGLFGAAGKAALCAGALCAAGSIWLLDWQGTGTGRNARSELQAPRSAPLEVAPAAQTPAPQVEPAAPVRAEPAPVAARPVEVPRVRRKVAAVAAAPESPAVAAPSSLAAELALLGRAQAALRAGQPAAALALAHEHERQYPDGVLKEERLGVAALSGCTLSSDDDKATERARAQAFLSAAPSSPLAARVRKACGIE